MIEYRYRDTGEVVTDRDFRMRLQAAGISPPSIVTEETLEEMGMDVVFEGPTPATQWWQGVVRSGVYEEDGKWYKRYVASPTFDDPDAEAEYVSELVARRNAELFVTVQNETQRRLDDFAATRNYSGIMSLCTYATSTIPRFRVEGEYGVFIRDATWAKLYEILAEIETGIRPVPDSFEDVEPELPVPEWPADPSTADPEPDPEPDIE